MHKYNGEAMVSNAAIDRVIYRARARRQLQTAPAIARALREQAGLTQKDVAEVLGVSRAAICRYEKGDRTPRGERAVRYLEILRRACEAVR